ncbi:hypothetical protein, partial [Barnesiella intestinihominis]|uniref:hypothetical protein n=1 Tax=Barnesiella intestinihominis TaxID=487174 RepID=UPI0026DB4DB3
LQNNIGKKTALQSSSPVLCTAKYRGGVQRTERLKKTATATKSNINLSPAVSRSIAGRYKTV